MNEGVEWALHSCLNLAWVGPEQAVPAAKLAAYYKLPAAYLNKQLQALARAGILSSISGPKGGFRLARDPKKITLMDVVTAIEGPDEAFRCMEIRQQAPTGDFSYDFADPCFIHQAMGRAELAWRKELAAQTVAQVKATVEKSYPEVPENVRRWFLRG